MKVKVIRKFKDKYTGETYKIGQELVLSVKRINEILRSGGFLELIEPEQEVKEKTDDSDQKTSGADEMDPGDHPEKPKTARRGKTSELKGES